MTYLQEAGIDYGEGRIDPKEVEKQTELEEENNDDAVAKAIVAVVSKEADLTKSDKIDVEDSEFSPSEASDEENLEAKEESEYDYEYSDEPTEASPGLIFEIQTPFSLHKIY